MPILVNREDITSEVRPIFFAKSDWYIDHNHHLKDINPAREYTSHATESDTSGTTDTI